MKFIKIIKNYKWHLMAVVIFAVGVSYYAQAKDDASSEATTSFYVVDAVERGEVTSGIQTTGDIVAAQKLDIDVYKKLSRIDVVNVASGSHVEAGDTLISFDKNDAYVDTQSSRVSVAEAALALESAQINANDPNTQIRTLENQIAGYEKSIVDTRQDIKDAYRDFLNEDLEIEPHPDKYNSLSDEPAPALSGRYIADVPGEYLIETYSSGAKSGYSYTAKGLGGVTEPLIFGMATDLGNGLSVTFPAGTGAYEKWIITVPNTDIATYEETKRAYEDSVANYEQNIRNTEVSLANAQQQLEDLMVSDSSTYRDLSVEKAETSLAEAQQRLSQNYDVVQERDIVAPFAGTVEGMENVVVGATPTGGTSDTINLGTLISDEFLTTFSLGATDVAKVSVGQKVKVTVTSFSEQPVFEAVITQISSLPESSGVAQYEVQALLEYDRTTAELVLREGMLADIEVVEEEKSDALRIPTSAVTYTQGQPKVTVIDKLTEQQQTQATRVGIVRTEGVTIETYTVDVELGIVGEYFVEILSGLQEGDIISVSALTETNEESVVQQAGFGPAGGRATGGQGGQGTRGN